jgi:hypothetical protein
MRAATVLSLCTLSTLIACATAAPGVGGDDDDDPPVDAARAIDAPAPPIDAPAPPIDAPAPPIDAPAPPIDAPAPPIDAPGPTTTVTLTQSSSLAVTPATSVACSSGENSYYRVFRLADHGVTGALQVSRVDFGVQDATALLGSQPVQVKLYALNGAFALANLTLLGTTTITVAATAAGTVVAAPIGPAITAPAGATLVVEVLAAGAFGNQFIMGANTAAETQPGYLRGPACGSAAPVTFASIAFPDAHIVMAVTGAW